ncbi:MAG: hypothetical protein ACYTGV_11720 [Planctomycetota bacterium]|jgi:hypothetical protein
MKRAIIPALLIGVLLCVPALSGGDEDEAVELAMQVKELKEQVAQSEARIKSLEAFLRVQQKAAAKLSKAVKFAEENGFAWPAPNIDAREALLKGLKEYSKTAAGGAKAGDPKGENK